MAATPASGTAPAARRRALSIRAKLFGAFGAILAILIGLGALALNRVSALDYEATEIADNWLPSVRWVSAMSEELTTYRMHVLRHILNNDPSRIQAVDRDIEMTAAKVTEAQRTYERLISLPEERPLFAAFSQAWAEYQRQAEPVLEASRRNDNDRARDLEQGRMAPVFDRALTAADELVRINVEGSQAGARTVEAVAKGTRTAIATGLGLSVLLGLGLAFWIIRGISSGIAAVAAPMEEMSKGRLDIAIPHVGEATEIGRIADSLQRLHGSLQEGERLRQEAAGAAERAVAERRRATLETAAAIESAVGGVASTIAASSTQLNASAAGLADSAAHSARQAGAAATGTAQAVSNVQTVAAAAEELSCSVSEITRQVAQSAAVAARAVETARRADGTMSSLADAAQRVGEVVRLISDIAGQTNLLALNATIEAARAGEAGKGFAVVASEVKQLAAQTARATEEIGGQIGAMRSATESAVAAIREIGQVIEEIHGIGHAIAAAVEEQGAATKEIARNVQDAASGATSAGDSVRAVSEGASAAQAAIADLRGAVGEIARQGDDLTNKLTGFLARMREAA